MFDSTAFEMPSASMEPEPEKTDVSVQEVGEIVSFFEKQIEGPENKWIGLMADAQENGTWDVLAHELHEDQGTNFTAAQLQTAAELNGGAIFKRAVQKMLEGDDEEEVDVTDKAA